MDTNHFEILLRETSFGDKMLASLWDALDTGRRIDLLLHVHKRRSGVPREILEKAIIDANALVRMLAVKGSYIRKEDTPELYAQLENDTSPFVRAAMRSRKFVLDISDLEPLSHDERLGLIALADVLSEEAFAKFISEGVKNETLSEHDAAELVLEFVRNPAMSRIITRKPQDGLDWYGLNRDFEAIWNLTTCTPWPVHLVIAREYPLRTGENPDWDHALPDGMIEKMSKEALKALACRQYRPLLKKLKEAPEKFDKEIHDYAGYGAEDNVERKADSDLAMLRREFDEFRTEMREALEALTKQITEFRSRHKGLFS